MIYPVRNPTSILCIGNDCFISNPGGLDRYAAELVYHLPDTDQVELCSFGLSNASEGNKKFTNLGDPKNKFVIKFFSSIKNFRHRKLIEPSAVNFHFALSALPLLQGLSRNVPITFTFHGPWALESKYEGANWLNFSAKYWIEHQVYRRCDRFIVLSQAFGTILHETYQIPWDKINVIPGGVDIQRFQPVVSQQTAREQLNWPAKRPVLFTPRRLVHRMGLDNLLQAMALVKDQVPEVWLAIAGKGPLREALNYQVQQLGLSSHVRLLGYLPEEQLPIAYQAADLTVVPTQQLEGFGLIVVESLACGTPVLCTPVGGMPEIVEPLSSHLLTQSPNADAIADRLIDILKNQLPVPSKVECRDYAVKHYNWQIIAEKVRQVLLA